MESQLPKGVWFEAPRNRWRVRLWRNKQLYISYHESVDDALKAYAALQALLSTIPRRRRAVTKQPVPVTSFRALCGSITKKY